MQCRTICAPGLKGVDGVVGIGVAAVDLIRDERAGGDRLGRELFAHDAAVSGKPLVSMWTVQRDGLTTMAGQGDLGWLWTRSSGIPQSASKPLDGHTDASATPWVIVVLPMSWRLPQAVHMGRPWTTLAGRATEYLLETSWARGGVPAFAEIRGVAILDHCAYREPHPVWCGQPDRPI